MAGKAAAFAMTALSLPVYPAFAQGTREGRPNAEEMIEVAREAYRPPGVKEPCPDPKPGEIVVCAPNPDEYRVSSSLDDAIDAGRAVPDGLPRAPDVFGLPPCEAYAFCASIGRAPEPPLLIDLEAIPEPLSPEDAALVFRAEDLPDASPVAASPAAAR